MSGLVSTTAETLDREKQAYYEVQVEAYDNPTGDTDVERTSIAIVKVTISDVNDNAPTFTGEPYAFSCLPFFPLYPAPIRKVQLCFFLYRGFFLCRYLCDRRH